LPVNQRSPKGVPIYGKSVIRAICRESAMCGSQRATGAMLLVLRNDLKLVRLVRRTAGAAVLRRSVALAFGWHPFDFSSRLRASRFYGQVLRSADIKAEGCDGTVDLGGESFGSPVFSAVLGKNLARDRSWPEAEPAVSGTYGAGAGRRRGRGFGERCAAGWRRSATWSSSTEMAGGDRRRGLVGDPSWER
jgi:hypothetical protein